MPSQPHWNIPTDLQAILDADEDGVWEDDTWQPILLSVMQGTSYDGRDIPLAWQIEFEPPGNRSGDDWSEIIRDEFLVQHMNFAGELHLDSEFSTCVIWVESEEVCRHLVILAWQLLQGGDAS